jgi:hypothetical protein
MATLVCVFKILCLFVDDAADQYHPADAYEGAPIIDICPDDRTVLNQQAIDSESETQRHCVLDVHGLRAYPGYGEKPLVFVSTRIGRIARSAVSPSRQFLRLQRPEARYPRLARSTSF